MSYYYLLWYRFKCVCVFGGFWQVRRVSTANPARPNEKVCETIKLLCNFGVEYQTFELPIIRLIASRVNKTGWVIPILSYLLWISMRTPFSFERISVRNARRQRAKRRRVGGGVVDPLKASDQDNRIRSKLYIGAYFIK